ncbi:MAG TPA: hypothetical protein VHA52_13030 [Candidatus Babeliaceae bacterium]|nr:hypothetical protein [Candidatus Babeliaceae bacterium]
MDPLIEDLIADVELEIESYQYDLSVNVDLKRIESGLPFFEELEEDTIINKLEAIMYLTKSYVIFDTLCNRFNLSLYGTKELLFLIENEEDGIFFNHINLKLPIEWRVIGYYILRDIYGEMYKDLLRNLEMETLTEIFLFSCSFRFVGDFDFYCMMIDQYYVDPSHNNYEFISILNLREDEMIVRMMLNHLDISKDEREETTIKRR